MERLPSYGRCFLCGLENPRGLRLVLFAEGEEVLTEFKLEEAFIGYEGIAHGGVLAGILDEVMWWAVAWHTGRASFTTELLVRYRRPALIGHTFRAKGRILRFNQRIVETEGEILDLETGEVCTSGSGRYYLLKGDRNREALLLLDYRACSEEVKRKFLEAKEGND